MAVVYTMQVYDTSGVLQSYVLEWENLAISLQCTAVDGATFTLRSYDFNNAYLTYRAMISISRYDRELDIPESVIFTGLIEKTEQIVTSYRHYRVTAVGHFALLSDRIIAYPSAVANRSRFVSVAAETVIKTLFNYNIGANATTANGRLLNGVITGMSTSASSGAGTVVTLDCSMKSLLQTIQDVAYTGGGDVSLDWTAPLTWSLVWYTGQRGTDRTSTVILSIPSGTIGELTITTDRITDFTTVIAGGAGVNKARIYATRPSPLPTGLNSREIYTDARATGNATLAALQQQSTALLRAQSRRRKTYRAKVLQNGSLLFGRDYFLGDLVTIRDNSTDVTQKVQGVNLQLDSNGQETVDVILADV